MLASSFGSRLARSPHLLLTALALAHCGTSSSPASAADAQPADAHATDAHVADAADVTAPRTDGGLPPSSCYDAAGISDVVCTPTASGVACVGSTTDNQCGYPVTTTAYCGDSVVGMDAGTWVGVGHSCGSGAGSGAPADAATDAPLD